MLRRKHLIMAVLSFMRDRVTWLNYFMLGYYAFLLNTLGPIAPFLEVELHLSYTERGLHFSAFALGMVLAGLLGDRISLQLGRDRLFWYGGWGMVAGIALLVTGKIPLITVGGTLLMGFGGSLMFFLIPTSLALHHPEYQLKVITEANVIASLFSIAAPLLISYLEGFGFGWRIVFYLAVASYAATHFVNMNIKLPAAAETVIHKQEGKLPPIFWLHWLRLFFSVSVEFCILFWGANFLQVERGFLDAEAVAIMSLVLFGMFTGRAFGSWLSTRLHANLIYLSSLVFVSIGFLVYAFIQYHNIGLIITGFGLANLYPMAFDQTLRSTPSQKDTASARLAMASGVAVLVMPFVLGWFADQTGIGRAYISIISVLIVLAFVIHFVVQAGKQP